MKFNGEQAEWNAFKNWLVENVITNTEFDSNEKLEIVREATNGTQAATLLDGVDNFEQAESELFDAFDSIYKVTQYEFRRLKAIRMKGNNSSEAIWNFIREFDDALKIFKEKSVMESVDLLVTLIAVDKLDQTTQVNWERQLHALSESWSQNDENKERKASDFVPTWDNLRAFLKDEAKFWLSCDTNKSIVNETPNTVVSSYASSVYSVGASTSTGGFTSQSARSITKASSNVRCFVCEQGHALKNCDWFLVQSISKRHEVVKHRALCKRCLHPQHQGGCRESSCNEPCPRCGNAIYHNSLLRGNRF